MLKPIVGVVAATLVTPALADEFWVQYDYNKHECSIVQSATHQTATRFPWSPPNDGRRPEGAVVPNSSDSTAGADGTNQANTPNVSNSTADATGETSAPNNSSTSSNAANKASPPNESNTTRGAEATNNTENDFAKELEASWKRKEELAKNNKIDVSTALVGSAMQTREQAEEEMQIMRICGLKN